MNRTLRAALVAALPLAALLPAPPGSAAGAGAGLTCGAVAVGVGDSGELTVDDIAYTIEGGPWHTTIGPHMTVTLTCVLEAEVHGFRWEVGRNERTGAGGVVVVPPAFGTFNAGGAPSSGFNLYVCTHITVYDPFSSPPYTVVADDADNDPTNGAQCAQSARQDQLVEVWTVPPQQRNGDRCVMVHHNVGPPPPEGACSPVG